MNANLYTKITQIYADTVLDDAVSSVQSEGNRPELYQTLEYWSRCSGGVADFDSTQENAVGTCD